MKLINKNEGTVYEAKNHFNSYNVRKFGKADGASTLTVSVSEFLPNGVATMSASESERVYYVLRGTLTVHDENGNAFNMEAGDTLYIPAGERRDMISTGEEASRLLVILAPVQ
jgi:quercetin dioxygenase-like cupin family protein